MSKVNITVKDIYHGPASIDVSRRAREKLSSLFAHVGMSKQDRDNILMAFSEHVNNIVEHNSEPCELFISFSAKESELKILDTGTSIKQLLKTTQSLASLLDGDELHESGMGLVMITSLFPSLRYQQRNEDTNQRFNQLILPVPRQKPHIVVIDDDWSLLSLLEAYLEHDYRIELFDQPRKALAYLTDNVVDMIICDVVMPEVTGLEFRQQLLKKDQFKALPFVFLSGDDHVDMLAKANVLEIDDFLVKPLDKQTLIRAIERVLIRSKKLEAHYNAALDEKITSGLWPKGPWVAKGCHVSLDYKAASRGGGDFLFHQELPNGHRYILGDVMGHGEQAKFFSYAISGFIHGYCESMQGNLDISAVLTHISNGMLESSLLSQTLVTICIIDVLGNQTFDIASAGHPPPMKISRDGSVSLVNVGGSLPGLERGAVFTPVSVVLEPGASLLAYTDGLIESVFNMDELDEACQKVESYSKGGVDGQTASTWMELFKVDEKALDDDVTLLYVKE